MVAIRAEATRMLARERRGANPNERPPWAGGRLTIIVGGIWMLSFLSVTTARALAIAKRAS